MPRASALQLIGEREQQRVSPGGGGEVRPDGQPRLGPMQRHRHRWAAGDVVNRRIAEDPRRALEQRLAR